MPIRNDYLSFLANDLLRRSYSLELCLPAV